MIANCPSLTATHLPYTPTRGVGRRESTEAGQLPHAAARAGADADRAPKYYEQTGFKIPPSHKTLPLFFCVGTSPKRKIYKLPSP
jgi:hypothetical protein